MNANERKALYTIELALSKLRVHLSSAHGAENVRNYLATFATAAIDAMQIIAQENGGEPQYLEDAKDGFVSDLEVAFMEAVAREECAEPKIDNRQYSTLNVVYGRVS